MLPDRPPLRVSGKILACVFALALGLIGSGCGGHSTPPPPVAGKPPMINGNFSISATSQVAPRTNLFGGAVQTNSSGNVTGNLIVIGPLQSCFGLQLAPPLTGAIDANGRFTGTLTSANNQLVTLGGQVSADGSALSGGTYTVNGTVCAADHGTVTGFLMQPFTGSYSGTFSLSPTTSIGLTVPLAQSANADGTGFFRFAPASVTVTGGSACGMTSATLDPTTSFADGSVIALNLTGSDGVTTVDFVGVTSSASTTSVTGTFTIRTGPCAVQGALGNLNRP